MKRIISLILTVACLMSVMPQVSFASGEAAAAALDFNVAGATGEGMTASVGLASTTPTAETVSAREAWVLGTSSSQNSYIKLAVTQPASATATSNYRLDVTYLDVEGYATFFVKYTNANSEAKVSNVVMTRGTGAWKTASFDLWGPVLNTIEITSYESSWGYSPVAVYIDSAALYLKETSTKNSLTINQGTGLSRNVYSGKTKNISFSIKNISGAQDAFTPQYKVIDEDGNIVKTGVGAAVSLLNKRTATASFDITFEKRGIFTVVIGVSTATGGYIEDSMEISVIPDYKSDARRSDFGTSAHFTYGGTSLQTMPYLEDIGVSIVRDEIWWQQYTNNGNDIPQKVTTFIDGMTERNLDILLILNGNNNSYDNGEFPTSDDAVAAFGDFVYDVVKKTAGKVKYFEIYNEADTKDKSSEAARVEMGKKYAKLLKTAYTRAKQAAKETNTECYILGPVSAGWDYKFGEGMKAYDANIGNYVDIISFHEYHHAAAAETKEGTWNYIKNELITLFGEKDIWQTEMGYTFENGLTEREAAMYSVRYILSNDWKNNFDKLFYYTWIDNVTSTRKPADYEGNFGMFYTDGQAKRRYIAYVAMNEMIKDKSPDNCTIDANGNYKYDYTLTNSKSVSVLFNANDEVKNISVTPKYKFAKVYDMYGNEMEIEANNGALNLTIDGEPVYVVSSNEGVNMDYETNKVFINASINGGREGKPIAIYALNPGYDKDDLLTPGAICYIDQIVLGAGGSYNFQFPMTKGAGTYSIYIGYAGSNELIGPATIDVRRDISASTSLFAGTTKIATMSQLQTVSEEKLTVKADILNEYNAKMNAMLYAAGYKNGTMIWADLISKAPAKGEDNMSFEVNTTDAKGADEIKIFLWTDDMEAITDTNYIGAGN